MSNRNGRLISFFIHKILPTKGDNIMLSRMSIGQLNQSAAMTAGITAVMIDLSGTLHIEDTAISGAQDALQK